MEYADVEIWELSNRVGGGRRRRPPTSEDEANWPRRGEYSRTPPPPKVGGRAPTRSSRSPGEARGRGAHSKATERAHGNPARLRESRGRLVHSHRELPHLARRQISTSPPTWPNTKSAETRPLGSPPNGSRPNSSKLVLLAPRQARVNSSIWLFAERLVARLMKTRPLVSLPDEHQSAHLARCQERTNSSTWHRAQRK